MGKSRLQIASQEIREFFKHGGAQILKRRDIDTILTERKDGWNLKASTTKREFLEFLITEKIVIQHEMAFPHRKEVRYTIHPATIFKIVQSLKPNGYFSHATALHLLGLGTRKTNAIYFNHEQPRKLRYDNELNQESVDIAFQCRCRVTRNVARVMGRKVYLLNGMHTGLLGVESIQAGGSEVRTTCLERTLIDATVRPVYSGGVRSVLESFRKAAPTVAITKLMEMLSALSYLYPYHQAVGFYLERSGEYTSDQVRPFERSIGNIDFYLTHQMTNPRYNAKWRMFYPKSL